MPYLPEIYLEQRNKPLNRRNICLVDFVVFILGLNAIFQHMIGYTWLPVLMVEEETWKSPERTTDPR